MPEKRTITITEKLFQQNGKSRVIAGNAPFFIGDEEKAFLTITGHIDLFLVEKECNEPKGGRFYCATAKPGQIILGIPELQNHYSLLAVAQGDTELCELPFSELKKIAAIPEHQGHVASMIDTWIEDLVAGAIFRPIGHTNVMIDTSEEITVNTPKTLRAKCGTRWVNTPPRQTFYLESQRLCDDMITMLPVTQKAWLTLQPEKEFSIKSSTTQKLLHENTLWPHLKNFHKLFMNSAVERVSKLNIFDREKLGKQQEANQRAWAYSASELKSVLTGAPPPVFHDAKDSPLLNACTRLAALIGIEVKPPPDSENSKSTVDKLFQIARASGFRVRLVKLTENWWEQDHGPVLAFTEKNDKPVVLIPQGSHSYILEESGGRSRAVNSAVYGELKRDSYVFYPPLPDVIRRGRDIIKLGLRACSKDIWIVVSTGIMAAIVALLTPIVTKTIIGTVIPSAERGLLVQIMMGLIAAAIGAATFEIMKAIALLRVSFKAEAVIQTGIWDRMLKLPVSFFRTSTAGDLSDRANSIMQIAMMIKGPVITAILSSIFASVNFIIMFHYDKKLAFVGLGMVVFAYVFIVVTTGFQMRAARRLYDIQGKISGLVLQLTNGIGKLRIAGAESRAFSRWATQFASQKRVDFKSKKIAISQQIFSKLYENICRGIIFALLLYHWKGRLDTSAYLAFITAFGSFMVAVLALTSVTEHLINAALLFRRVEPILDARPEQDDIKKYPGQLNGAVEINQVTFRYDSDAPLVLKDVSIHADPGEFIAIVGSSGSGKSTLFRLLLGFETPESGGIYFDSQDLSGLDVSSVRKQMGVVLQNGSVMPGDIYTNIVGAAQLTLDDAWEAAKTAGIADDIRNMPMEMNTVISEGGGTFSGGQRQRLMIARAVVGKPKILLFDEATSALDNTTQAQISRSIEQLQTTRIVIAHRLSTIINADRIYVLDKGILVQQGTYEELMSVEGSFKEQATRQLT